MGKNFEGKSQKKSCFLWSAEFVHARLPDMSLDQIKFFTLHKEMNYYL